MQNVRVCRVYELSDLLCGSAKCVLHVQACVREVSGK